MSTSTWAAIAKTTSIGQPYQRIDYCVWSASRSDMLENRLNRDRKAKEVHAKGEDSRRSRNCVDRISRATSVSRNSSPPVGSKRRRTAIAAARTTRPPTAADSFGCGPWMCAVVRRCGADCRKARLQGGHHWHSHGSRQAWSMAAAKRWLCTGHALGSASRPRFFLIKRRYRFRGRPALEPRDVRVSLPPAARSARIIREWRHPAVHPPSSSDCPTPRCGGNFSHQLERVVVYRHCRRGRTETQAPARCVVRKATTSRGGAHAGRAAGLWSPGGRKQVGLDQDSRRIDLTAD